MRRFMEGVAMVVAITIYLVVVAWFAYRMHGR